MYRSTKVGKTEDLNKQRLYVSLQYTRVDAEGTSRENMTGEQCGLVYIFFSIWHQRQISELHTSAAP